jgi:RimJ/RimL family protein N-acetyltransferase
MHSAPYLETQRLRLRRFTAGEADLLIELDSDPEVMRYISGGAPSDPERIRTVTLPSILAWYDRDDRYGLWAAELKEGREFAGWFHFWPAKQEPHDIEVGYRLEKKFWGRGLATEGTVALIRLGFETYGLERVVARTLRENAASRRVLEKAGMTYLPEADYFEDLHPGSPPAVWYEIRRDAKSSRGLS